MKSLPILLIASVFALAACGGGGGGGGSESYQLSAPTSQAFDPVSDDPRELETVDVQAANVRVE